MKKRRKKRYKFITHTAHCSNYRSSQEWFPIQMNMLESRKSFVEAGHPRSFGSTKTCSIGTGAAEGVRHARTNQYISVAALQIGNFMCCLMEWFSDRMEMGMHGGIISKQSQGTSQFYYRSYSAEPQSTMSPRLNRPCLQQGRGRPCRPTISRMCRYTGEFSLRCSD